MRDALVTGLLLTLLALLGAPGAAPAAGDIELRADPVPDELRQRMRHWHRRYREEISPVVREWQRVARAARRSQPPETLATGCRRLAGAIAGLDRRALSSAPDRSVALHLEEGLRSLTAAARGCTQGAYFLADWRLRQAAGSWSELRGRLHLYGLVP